jgi:glycosyltransferase involved in cell wall biosynthesis
MRVLHWYPNLLGGGAVATAVMGLAGAQAALGADVLVAAVQSRRASCSRLERDAEGLRVFCWQPSWRLGSGKLILRGLALKDRRELAAWLPDVVHIHGEFNPDNLWVPSLFRCVKVLSPHGAFHPLVLGRHRMWKKIYIALAKELLYKRVAFHALSPLEKNYILRIVPRAKVFVFPNCSSPAIEEYLSEGGDSAASSSDSISFLYAGRLDVFHKALDTILAAFAIALQNTPDKKMMLLLAGRDFSGGRKALQRLAGELGIAANIEFLGHLNETEMARAYRSADIYLQLSRNDAFSLSAAEALLAGKPVILGNEVGPATYREINRLPHVSVVPADTQSIARAMIQAAGHLKSLLRAAQENRVKIRDFLSWKRVAAGTLDAYRALPWGPFPT